MMVMAVGLMAVGDDEWMEICAKIERGIRKK